MGMGYSACYADVIDEGWIEDVAPIELNNFKTAVEKADVDIEAFAQESQCGGGSVSEDWGDEVDQTYDDLVTKFKESTGLSLGIYYHNSTDDGSRYDDVDGVFWAVDGVYEYTKAGETHKDRINRRFYVTFG